MVILWVWVFLMSEVPLWRGGDQIAADSARVREQCPVRADLHHLPDPTFSVNRKVDVRLPGKGNSTPHGARPVHLIMAMIKWIRTRRLSTKNSRSAPCFMVWSVRRLMP